jgi:hypothetical protein
MKHIDLLMSKDCLVSLDEFANLFFEITAVKSSQERESSHYFGGRYFIGSNGSTTYKIMLTDDEDHRDLPFWVRLSAPNAETLADNTVDELALSYVHKYGLNVARVENFGMIDEKRFDYSR